MIVYIINKIVLASDIYTDAATHDTKIQREQREREKVRFTSRKTIERRDGEARGVHAGNGNDDDSSVLCRSDSFRKSYFGSWIKPSGFYPL